MADKITNIESVHNSAAPIYKRLSGEAWLSNYPCLLTKGHGISKLWTLLTSTAKFCLPETFGLWSPKSQA